MIDWAGLMRVGLSGLGLAPDAFWRLTPVELRVMLGAAAGVPPLTRARLEELARAYPDRNGESGIERDRGVAGSGGGSGKHAKRGDGAGHGV